MGESGARFHVDPTGAIVLTSSSGERVLREMGIEGAADVEDIFGVSLDRLREGSRDGIRVPTLLGFVDVEDLVDRAGKPAGLLVSAEDEVLRGTRFAPSRDHTMDVVRGNDPSVAAAIDLAERYAKTSLPLLIVAERGAGGLRLARWIHGVGPSGDLRLAEVDAKVLVEPVERHPTLAALAAKESADVLVRSIDEAPRPTQDDIARAFQGPLAHVRLIAWSHTDPRAKEGWSPDLTRLLRVSTVALPALRERTDRVVVAETMLSALARDRSLSAASRRLLEGHPFPGNLTELEIVLQRARVHAGDRRVLEPEDFPAHLHHVEKETDVTRRGAERVALEDALRASRGNLSGAAKRLGVARTTLYRMLERHEDAALRVVLEEAVKGRASKRR